LYDSRYVPASFPFEILLANPNPNFMYVNFRSKSSSPPSKNYREILVEIPCANRLLVFPTEALTLLTIHPFTTIISGLGGLELVL
jgi:hypothetical protein